MADEATHILTATSELQLGSTIGSYELVALLGKGSMGRVYRARHVRLGREVALKVLNSEYVARPDMVQRFFREARVVNEINNENIVEVTDFVEQPGLAYLVMELLDGTSLREMMRQKGKKYPAIKKLVPILVQICKALDAAHDKGVVHRDLKPDNVFVSTRNGEDFVKVLDFGVAKLRDSGDANQTSAGMILGTPHYMAPEQALGEEVDRRTDVWALGVVMYELAAGAVPFKANSFVELALTIREQPARALPAKTPRGERVPQWFRTVVDRCLQKKPADRYRSMEALAEALTEQKAPGTTFSFPRWLLGGRVVAAAAVATVVVAALYLRVPDRLRGAFRKASRSVQTAVERAPALVPELPPLAPPEPAAEQRDAVGAREAPSEERAAAGVKRSAQTEREPAGKRQTEREPASGRARHAAVEKPRQPTVELHIRTTPPGARVVRRDTGERLGRTPLRVNVPKKAATVWIELSLDGYRTIPFSVDLRHDNAAEVTLPPAKRPARRR